MIMSHAKAPYTPPLEHKLTFERTISKISSRFVMIQGDLHAPIQESLSDMGQVSGASRAYIFQFENQFETMSNTYEWCADGVIPEIENLQGLPTSYFPWWMAKLQRKEIISIRDVAALPEEAEAEKAILSEQGIQALIVLPIVVGSELFGYIGFDDTTHTGDWSEDDILLLKIAAELFGSAFNRMRYERELLESNLALHKNISEIKHLQNQLIQQEKMVGIGQLAAGIAHEINNPLGFVSSNYEVLEKYVQRIQSLLKVVKELIVTLEDPESNRDCHIIAYELTELWKSYKMDRIVEDMVDLLDDSKIGFERVSQIIMSLRNFAHTDLNNLQENDNLHQILEEVLVILSNEIKYCAEVDKQFGNLPLIPCNRGQVGQVFINLLMNAVYAIKKASHMGYGKIQITTFLTEDGYACIQLSDNGTGIPPETLPQIFNPFFTTKDVGEGTGLGLSISYDIIVNKHRGDLSVESKLGEGTTFTIKLPLT